MDANELVARLFGLWDDVPATDEAAREAFLDLYEDPVLINGTVMPVDELVRRARALSAALHDRSTEVLSVVPSTDRLAVAFRIRGVLAGVLDTPIGPVTGAGEAVTMQVIDVLVLNAGRIREIWMVADQLGLLAGLGAVALTPPRQV